MAELLVPHPVTVAWSGGMRNVGVIAGCVRRMGRDVKAMALG